MPAQAQAYGRYSLDEGACRKAAAQGSEQPLSNGQLAPSNAWQRQAGIGLQCNSLSMPSTPDPLGTLLAAAGANPASLPRPAYDQLPSAGAAAGSGCVLRAPAAADYASAAAALNMQLHAGHQHSVTGPKQQQHGQQPAGCWQQLPFAGQDKEQQLLLAELAGLGPSVPCSLVAAAHQPHQLPLCSSAATGAPSLAQLVGAAAGPSAGYSTNIAPFLTPLAAPAFAPSAAAAVGLVDASQFGLLPAGQLPLQPRSNQLPPALGSTLAAIAAPSAMGLAAAQTAALVGMPRGTAPDALIEAELEAELDAALQRLLLMRNEVALKRACASGGAASTAANPGLQAQAVVSAGPAQAPSSSLLAPSVLASQLYQPGDALVVSGMPSRRSFSAAQLAGPPDALLSFAAQAAPPRTQAFASFGACISSVATGQGRVNGRLLPASASATVYAQPSSTLGVARPAAEPTMADLLSCAGAGVVTAGAPAAAPLVPAGGLTAAAAAATAGAPMSLQQLRLLAMCDAEAAALRAEQCMPGMHAPLGLGPLAQQPLAAAQPRPGLPQQQLLTPGYAGQCFTSI
jgi:hypothetical protein